MKKLMLISIFFCAISFNITAQDTPPIATTAAATADVFMYYFNKGNVDDLIDVYYEKGAVLVSEPGTTVTGDDLRASISKYFELKGKMSGTARHTIISGGTALLIIDWVVDYVDENGNPAKFPGISTDIVRQGGDGIWRCIIDNPHNIK